MSQLLERYKWDKISEGLLSRFLMLYKTCVDNNDDAESNLKGFEVCLRYIMDNLESQDLMEVVR